MKKLLAWLLCLSLLLSLAPAVSAAEGGSFVLTAANANSIIIEPEYIRYTQGQTVQEALLASHHEFVGLEQGFIYAIDGVDAGFQLFYDGGEFDLTVPASDITTLCIGVTSQYSEALLTLIQSMAEYRNLGNVRNFPAAQAAYAEGLTAIRRGDGDAAQAALDQLNAAIAAYDAQFSGTKYTVTVAATQGGTTLADPTVTLTDLYGNETMVKGTTLPVIAGDYSFRVSDGGYNRTEGKLTVSGATTLAVTLPSGQWFGKVNILDEKKDPDAPFPCVQDEVAHTATFRIPDTAKKLGSLYLNVYQGADIPDREKTKLRTIYTGVNGNDFSTHIRSWESTATALTYLVEQGMTGTRFPLEAQYVDASGHTQIQSYEMILERVPTLASLTVSAEGTLLPLTFDPVTYSYDLVTVSDTLEINAQAFGADYNIVGTGSVAVSGSHTVTVSYGDKSTSYQLNITKRGSVGVTISKEAGVSGQVFNTAGSVIAPVGDVYHLIPGETYRYIATKAEHYHTTADFTAAEGLTVQAATPTVSDWLNDLALYNSRNASNRVPYEAVTAFAPDVHSCTYKLSDCNSTAYIQATSDKKVTASYRSQTNDADTNGLEQTVTVTKTVGDGVALILPKAVTKSGYHNTVTLRLSEEKNGVTYYQDYTLTLARVLHLSELSLEQNGEALQLMDGTGAAIQYDRDITSYTIKVNRDSTELLLNASFPNTTTDTDCCGGYYALVNDRRYDSLEKLTLDLNPELEKETIAIRVCHADNSSISETYQITVEKTDPVALTIATTPGDAVVFLTNDLNGKRVLPQNGTYLLTPGGSYSYILTAKGYVGATGSFTAPQENGTKSLSLTKAAVNSTLVNLSSEWPHLRQNSDNNGVVSYPMPTTAENTVLSWATQIGAGFDNDACGCPILVDGYLYTYAGSTIYKVDTISGEIVATGAMDHGSSFAINPPTYADGMLFIGLADGTVQAFNAATLESLWIYRDPLGGQPNCSITYHNGYVYTGFWVGETSNASFVCLTATDEDPSSGKEEKLATWRYTSKGGFYWAGAYVCDDYLLVGTDDGESGYTRGYPSLLSFNPTTGELLSSRKMGVVGDIRSSITCYNGKYYFTNKGGYFFEATVGSNGIISGVRTLKLTNYASDASAPPMSTCTPTIYNGRAYIGVSGTSQFGAYSGHNITVIDIPNWEIAYTVRTQGYPQTSGVLTTAYSSDAVYVYFFDNYTPGKLRMLEDRPGQNKPSLVTVEKFNDKGTDKTFETAYALFTPSGDQAQYALCSPIVDRYGNIYFKNDSAYLMAVGSAVTKLEITSQPEKLTYKEGEYFHGDGLTVTAHYANGTSRDVTNYVTWSEEALTAADTDFIITFPYAMYQNKDGQSGVECEKPFATLTLTIEGGTKGDFNGDNNINMKDVTLLLQAINDSEVEKNPAMDINGDNNINMVDVTELLKIINTATTQAETAE